MWGNKYGVCHVNKILLDNVLSHKISINNNIAIIVLTPFLTNILMLIQ